LVPRITNTKDRASCLWERSPNVGLGQQFYFKL
jgi:hypothetical protein